MEKNLVMPINCFGIFVEPNIYIPVAIAKEINHPIIDKLTTEIKKNFPDTQIEVINFSTIKKEIVLIFECLVLGQPVFIKHEPPDFSKFNTQQ